MRRLLALALPALFAAVPAPAQDAAPFALWGDSSGSLPPQYAWEYSATFHTDGRVAVQYCKGYDAAGCATVDHRLPEADLAALQAALAPLAAALLTDPPRTDPHPPVGGGSRFGAVTVGGEKIALPSFPVAEDQARVTAILNLLQAYTPQAALARAKDRAKAP